MLDFKDVSLARAALVSLCLESLAFGAFSVTLGTTLFQLSTVAKGTTAQARRSAFVAFTCTLMYLLCLAHIVLSVSRTLKDFAANESGWAGTSLFYARVSAPMEVAKIGLCFVMNAIADGFMAFQVYVVWNRNRWIAIPSAVLCLATAVSGFVSCTQLRALDVPRLLSTGTYDDNIKSWIEATFSLALAGHGLSTGLIAGRLVWAHGQLRKYKLNKVGRSIWDVVETVVQFLLIHSVVPVCLLVTFVAHSNAWFILLDIVPPLLGVTFTYLTMRVEVGKYQTAAEMLHAHIRRRDSDQKATKIWFQMTQRLRQGNIKPVEIAVCVTRESSDLVRCGSASDFNSVVGMQPLGASKEVDPELGQSYAI